MLEDKSKSYQLVNHIIFKHSSNATRTVRFLVVYRLLFGRVWTVILKELNSVGGAFHPRTLPDLFFLRPRFIYFFIYIL